MLSRPLGGAEAVAQLGANLERGAKRAGMTTSQFASELRTDATLRVDVCGYPYYVEPVADPPVATPSEMDADSDAHPQASPGIGSGLDASGDVFALASRPGSLRTIYLNFKGATVSGTGWNSYFNGGAPIVAPAFSLDADGSTFSEAERDVIRETWLRVAEDYSPFDVNVTTEDLGAEAIKRNSADDDTFGTVALITNESQIYARCGCGGVAYVGVFDVPGSNTYYQPAWVFALGMYGSAKNIAEAASHELGHNLGLAHDGTVAHDSEQALGYYTGQGSWAPIMGVGYFKPVSQWSKGEYGYANNPQDDLSVIAANGVQAVPDDHGGSPATATQLSAGGTLAGIVGNEDDADWFVFDGSSATTIAATAQSAGGNLDIGLQLYDRAGSLLAGADPGVQTVSPASATGLDATITTALAPGTYYVKVDGVGHESPVTTGYSDYASLGRYDIRLTTTPPPTPPLVISTDSLPDATAREPYSVNLAASGGSLPYVWEVASGSLPEGLLLDPQGVISGTPMGQGEYPVSLRVTDARARTAVAQLSLVVAAPPLRVVTSSLPAGEVGAVFSVMLEASGGSLPYVWEVASGSLPEGLLLDPQGVISGQPMGQGEYSVSLRVTDARARTAVAQLSLVVAAPPLRVVTSSLPAGEVGAGYSVMLEASGGSLPYSWEVASGSLPEGLALDPQGLIFGTPTETMTAAFTVSVTDGQGSAARGSLVLPVVLPGLRIVTMELPVAEADLPYSVSLVAQGGTEPYTWSVIGRKLPMGLTLSASGVISGEPERPGLYTFIVRVTDADGATATKRFILRISR